MASWKKIIVSGSIAEFNHISASGDIVPVSDGVSNLGSAGQEFQDLFIDGTANIDSLVADTANIDAGTIDGVTLGTNSAITEAQIDNININGSTIKDFTLVSGSITSTGSFGRVEATTIAGHSPITVDSKISFNDSIESNVSSSVTSTGSFSTIRVGGQLGALGSGLAFGDGDTGFYETADDDFKLDRGGNNVFRANTSSGLDFGVSNLFYNQTGGFWINSPPGSAAAPNYVFRGDTDTGMFRIDADRLGFSTGGVLRLEVSEATISGSAVSTGSFGRLKTASEIADIGGNIVTIGGALTTAGDFTTQNNNVTINAAGADRSITLNESLTIGDGNDGTLTFSAASKTLTVEDTSVVNQDLTTDANVTFATATTTGNVTVGGDLVVNGDTTTVATSNLIVQDAFGFFATGSAGSNVDAGIVVQSGSFVNSGSAFYHDINAERWSVAKSVAATSTAVTPLESVVTVKEPGDNGAPADADVEYGVGEMFINSDGTIWIYS